MDGSENIFVRSFRWDDRNVRKWLKNEFIVGAFGEVEMDLIIETQNIFTKSSDVDETTDDFVFILDSKEAEKYLAEEDERVCQATTYAKRKVGNKESENVPWVLREVGGWSDICVMQVKENGEIDMQGAWTTSYHYVRPAMWVNIAE